jgi:CBS domain containing-hemolysin-like protein
VLLLGEVGAEGSHWALDLSLLLLVPALVAVNGLFVAAEFSLVAVRRTRVEELIAQGVRGARAVEKALAGLPRAIAATQLGITLASLALGFVAEPALAGLLDHVFDFLPNGYLQFATVHTLAGLLAFCLITFLHVVFGELIPKNIALQMPDRVALVLARPLLWFTFLTRPLVAAMNGAGYWLLRLAGFQAAGQAGSLHSVEELELLIEDTQEAGLIDEDQAEFVQNVFALSGKKVIECMVPREKMATLDANAAPEQILAAVRAGAHTRMPVYDGHLDEVVGIVNTKDLFHLFSLQGVVILQDAMYPPLFLRHDDSLGIALRTLRKSHRHMALVRDDNDRIIGLITLEDVIEEIIGEIEDEHDHPGPRMRIRRIRATPAVPRQGDVSRQGDKEARRQGGKAETGGSANV